MARPCDWSPPWWPRLSFLICRGNSRTAEPCAITVQGQTPKRCSQQDVPVQGGPAWRSELPAGGCILSRHASNVVGSSEPPVLETSTHNLSSLKVCIYRYVITTGHRFRTGCRLGTSVAPIVMPVMHQPRNAEWSPRSLQKKPLVNFPRVLLRPPAGIREASRPLRRLRS